MQIHGDYSVQIMMSNLNVRVIRRSHIHENESPYHTPTRRAVEYDEGENLSIARTNSNKLEMSKIYILKHSAGRRVETGSATQ